MSSATKTIYVAECDDCGWRSRPAEELEEAEDDGESHELLWDYYNDESHSTDVVEEEIEHE